MGRYEISIELLSDLCVSDGGVYNSAVDTESCHDEYGLPYIPAKRLKGCLRESALELNDWGENIDISKIFGEAGEHSKLGVLKVNDAYFQNYQELKKEIDAGKNNSILYHPQNVLGQFSYVRTQTAIDSESGIAKDGSLRTIRVVNKGLKFKAEAEFPDSYLDSIKKIAANFNAMGMNRTRGLGEVKVSVEKKNKEIIKVPVVSAPGATILEYALYLEEPVICKNVLGAEENTLDYIDGAKILGMIAERYKKQYGKEITSLLDAGKIEFSNAYISEGTERFTEVPGYIYKIKNNNEKYVNKLYEKNENTQNKNSETRQLNGMKHTYVAIGSDGTLDRKDVAIELHYHHRRPEDKSVGRAAEDGTGNSMFYQISSISKGQCFRGFISGIPEQIEIVKDLMASNDRAYIGYGSSSEYGLIKITELKAEKNSIKTIDAEKIIVKLNAPAIVYGKNASYSTDADEDLKAEIAYSIGLTADDLTIERKFIKYTQVGGYNVTWNRRKPTVTAFDKGTALLISLKGKKNINIPKYAFLGERNAEGFGEFTIEKYDNKDKCEFGYADKKVKSEGMRAKVDLSKNPLALSVAGQKFESYIRSVTVEYAESFNGEAYRPVVSNMLIMCSETDNLSVVKENVETRYDKVSSGKQEKLAKAHKILDCVEDRYESILENFDRIYNIKGFEIEEDKIKCEILKSLLINIKYSIKNQKEEERR